MIGRGGEGDRHEEVEMMSFTREKKSGSDSGIKNGGGHPSHRQMTQFVGMEFAFNGPFIHSRNKAESWVAGWLVEWLCLCVSQIQMTHH